VSNLGNSAHTKSHTKLLSSTVVSPCLWPKRDKIGKNAIWKMNNFREKSGDERPQFGFVYILGDVWL
jgi:hypothetical protein